MGEEDKKAPKEKKLEEDEEEEKRKAKAKKLEGGNKKKAKKLEEDEEEEKKKKAKKLEEDKKAPKKKKLEEDKKKPKKTREEEEEAQTMERLAEELSAKVEVDEKNVDWKSDPFLKHLKDEMKYTATANNKDKWFLIKMVIGKTVSMLGVKTDDVFAGLKLLNDKNKLDAFEIILKFQKSMSMDDLKPLAEKFKFKGLSGKQMVPTNRTFLLNFLNCHIRQP